MTHSFVISIGVARRRESQYGSLLDGALRDEAFHAQIWLVHSPRPPRVEIADPGCFGLTESQVLGKSHRVSVQRCAPVPNVVAVEEDRAFLCFVYFSRR